jgi:hypothetical protein
LLDRSVIEEGLPQNSVVRRGSPGLLARSLRLFVEGNSTVMETRRSSPFVKRMALGATLFLAACGMYAQDETSPPPTASSGMQSTFGVKGGANWSTLWVKEVKDKNARLGFHAGLFARFASPNSLGFQIEALYDQKGMTVTKTFGTIDQEITYEFDYATVPLLIVVPLGEVAEIHAGAYGSLLLLSEISSRGDLGDAEMDPDDGKFKSFDFGLSGGVGINLGLAQIGARYNHGLQPVADNPSSRGVLGESQNASAQLYLSLGLGKK